MTHQTNGCNNVPTNTSTKDTGRQGRWGDGPSCLSPGKVCFLCFILYIDTNSMFYRKKCTLSIKTTHDGVFSCLLPFCAHETQTLTATPSISIFGQWRVPHHPSLAQNVTFRLSFRAAKGVFMPTPPLPPSKCETDESRPTFRLGF